MHLIIIYDDVQANLNIENSMLFQDKKPRPVEDILNEIKSSTNRRKYIKDLLDEFDSYLRYYQDKESIDYS